MEKEPKIKVLLIEAMEYPRMVEIENSVKGIQAAVGGKFQAIYPWEDEVGLVCNENAIFEGCPLNRALRREDGSIYDFLRGTFFICGLTTDNFGSLSDEMAEKYSKLFQYPETLIRATDGRLVFLSFAPGAIPMILNEP